MIFSQLSAVLGIVFIAMFSTPTEPLLYSCDGNYSDKVWQIQIQSCSQNFIDMAKSYLQQNDSGKVMRIRYLQADSWMTDCNGAFTTSGNILTVYTCSKDEYVVGVGQMTPNRNIKFTFLHELAHAHIRQNHKEYEADQYALARLS